MRNILALSGQSIFDIALLFCGDATKAWDIARTNAIPLTATFEKNTTLSIPDDMNNVAKVFKQEKVVFATGIVGQIWIMATGNWNDEGVWMDGEIWND